MKQVKFIIVVCCFCFTKCVRWSPVVQTKQGKLKGVVSFGGTHYKYLGIPYASVIRRFQDPEEPPKWLDTFSASQAGPKCAQYGTFMPTGSEDCLNLNVYTPIKFYGTNVPVMVFFHGGGFYWGSNSPLLYSPGPLIAKGVIVVTINYRLGPFGFLCLGLDEAPGNAGLKDQVTALKWIRDNIKGFGGDPKSVTIFGQSAGASSVHLLILSPTARGLFHRAILESGTALAPFAFDYTPIDSAVKVALRLGFNTKDPKKLLRIFQNATQRDLLTYSQEGYIFKPCVETHNAGGVFLDKTPYQILTAGNYTKVPMIIGYNNREGIRYAGRYFIERKLDDVNENFEKILPEILDFKTQDDTEAAVQQLKDFYFKGQNISERTVEQLIDLMSDIYVDFNVIMSINLHLRSSDLELYSYYFSYDSTRNLAKLVTGLPTQEGASHADEIFYLFQPEFWIFPPLGQDAIILDRMTTLWTDFAKSGNPTVKTSKNIPMLWPRSYAPNGLQFLSINRYLTTIPLPNQERIRFWQELFDKYGRK